MFYLNFQCNFQFKWLIFFMNIAHLSFLALFTELMSHFHADFQIKYFLKVSSTLFSLFTKEVSHLHTNFVIKDILKMLWIILALSTKVVDHYCTNFVIKYLQKFWANCCLFMKEMSHENFVIKDILKVFSWHINTHLSCITNNRFKQAHRITESWSSTS